MCFIDEETPHDEHRQWSNDLGNSYSCIGYGHASARRLHTLASSALARTGKVCHYGAKAKPRSADVGIHGKCAYIRHSTPAGRKTTDVHAL